MKRFTILYQTIIILLVQVLVLDDIHIHAFSILGVPIFSVMLYPLAIIILPVHLHHWIVMIIAFVLGIVVDLFSNTPGLHASALVLMAYIRPYLLNLFFQQNIKELGTISPTLFQMGFKSFFLYLFFTISIHHVWYYLFQIWSLGNVHIVIIKSIVSIILTMMLCIFTQLIFAKRTIQRI